MPSLARLATLAVMAMGGLAMIAAPAAAVPPSPSAQDVQFLRQAHQTNLAEIALGKMAQQKGNSPTVKNLGAKFMTDHTNLDKILVPVAHQIYVTLPSAPSSQQQAVATQLKHLSGAQFDRQWVQSEFTGHTQALQAAKAEIANGSNLDVTSVAKQSAPVIESHRDDLQAAARSMGIPLPTTAPPTPATPRQGGTPGH